MTDDINSLCPPKRKLTPEAYAAARQATALLVKEQNVALVEEFFSSGAVETQRVIGVEGANPRDDFFYAIVRDDGPAPMQATFRLRSFKLFAQDERVFRDAHAMLQVLALSSSEAPDFFYIIAALINSTTWQTMCYIALHGSLPLGSESTLLAACLHFGRFSLIPGLLDAIETKFERKERDLAHRQMLMNIDWYEFTLVGIEQRYQNGTEMKTWMRSVFLKGHRKRMLCHITTLTAKLLHLRFGKQITMRMIKASIHETTLTNAVVTEADIEEEYTIQQTERFDRVLRNSAHDASFKSCFQ